MCVGYSANWREQVSAAVASGTDIVHFIFRSDDQHLSDLGLDRISASEKVAQIASFIRSMGVKEISFGPSFASQADPQFLVDFVNTAISNGVNQVVISDSTGVMNPEGFSSLVTHIKENCKCKVAVHCHNDFGLALANTIAGLRAGAQIVESSVGGLGERAGNVPTEEIVMALKYLYSHDLGIDFKKLAATTRSVFSICKLRMPPLKPIVGSNTFTQKLDIHVMTTRVKPWLHEPFDPEIVGMKRTLVIGKRSGPIAVKEKAKELALSLPDSKVAIVVKRVNDFSDQHKRALTDDEFVAIVRAV
jgi:isopropylmalate/homocitrate/citramalate synthase